MKKIIREKTIYFYDENDNEIMYMDHSTDECIWFFNSDKKITLNQEDELYSLINNLMNNNYSFSNDELENYKDKKTLIWYSDCYYNPDDEWSLASVSCLHIEKEENAIVVWPTKKLDEMISRNNKTYGICFSPAGNGKYSRNQETGTYLQDDFVTMVYQKLLERNKTLRK